MTALFVCCRLHPMSGALPYLKKLAPELSGAALASHLASTLDVSYSTVYDWMKRGMATAQMQNVLKVAKALADQGHEVSLGDLESMCEQELGNQ